jgi:Tat protein secretion system quality control protein TatD with DNase activity
MQSRLRFQEFELLVRRPHCCAIGEVGLEVNPSVGEKEWQQQLDLLTMILTVANALKKPLVIHLRNQGGKLGKLRVQDIARELCATYLNTTHRIYLHCFMGTHAEGMQWRDKFPHCFFGYGPKIVTKRLNWRTVLAVRSTTAFFKEIEFDRILLESDSPYQKLGDEVESPHLVYRVAQDLAKLVHVPFAEVVRRTTANATDFHAK